MPKLSLQEELNEVVVIYNPHAKDISSKDAKIVRRMNIAILIISVILAMIVTYLVSYCFFSFTLTYIIS